MIGDPFAETLRDAQAGKAAAFETIYRDLAPQIGGFARGRGVADPEDVVSETMISLVNGLESFTGDEASFRSWVFTIAFRRVVDSQRRAGRQVPTQVLGPVDPAAPAPSPEELLLAQADDSPVMVALRRLKPDQRDVLLLRIVAGLPVEEVSSILGKRSSAVKMIQQRALTRLRAELGESRTVSSPTLPSDSSDA